MKIRLVTLEDSSEILEWRNDPDTRKMFISTARVEPEEHQRWLQDSLKNPLRVLYIGLEGEKKVGICRFDYSPEKQTAEISINLNPSVRGMNLSVPFLQTSIDSFRESNRCPLTATVKKGNLASIRCFEKCNFIYDRQDEVFNYYVLP